MKKTLSLIIVLSILLISALSLFSCAPAAEPKQPEKLPAPVLTLSGDTASWESIEGAIGYELGIGIAIIKCDSSVTSRKLEAGDTLLVRAVGDGTSHLTSPWSNSVTYGQKPQDPPRPKLETPVVTLSGSVASWESIEGAVGYELSIGMSLIEVGGDVTSYTLEDGDVLILRALSGSAATDHSEWSSMVKYTDGSGTGSGGGSGTGSGGGSGTGSGDTTCAAHTDTDSNGRCDTCDVSVIVVIDFYAINDLHGKFCDTSTQPGVDELATFLKGRENIDDNVVVLSSGDMWQGTAESNLTFGALMTEWMNIIGTVSMTLGNHEYDWGEEYIRSNLEIADFPFLAINIYDISTGKRADYCAPSVMIEEGGLQIGIIGAIGDCYTSILADMVAGVEFKVGSELTALVSAEAARLRALGADLIVYSLHDSTAGYSTSLSNGSVDLVFEGHSHSTYTTQDVYGVYHIQGGGENKGISHAEVEINSVTGKVSVSEAGVISSSEYASFADDPETEALEEKYRDIIDMATTPLGNVTTALADYEVEDLVARLYYEAGVRKWGGEYNVVLGGGFLKTRSPYDLHSGSVTYADLMSILPFNNQLVLCSVSGQKLLSKFINTTNGDYHSYYTIDPSSISYSGTYYVIVDTYTSAYAPNGLTEIARYDETTYARDLLADYIKSGGLDMSQSDYTLTSIADVLSVGASLAEGETTSELYYVRGTVERVVNTESGLKYGNLYLTDGEGNTVYVYGLYDKDGNMYENMTAKPVEGDEIIIMAKIQNYKPSSGDAFVELKSAVLIEAL